MNNNDNNTIDVVGNASTKKRWLVGLVTNENWQDRYLAASEANNIIKEKISKSGIFFKHKKKITLEDYLKTDAVINDLLNAIVDNKKEAPIKVVAKSNKQLNVILMSKKLKPAIDKIVLSKFAFDKSEETQKIQKYNRHYKNVYYQSVLNFIKLKK